MNFCNQIAQVARIAVVTMAFLSPCFAAKPVDCPGKFRHLVTRQATSYEAKLKAVNQVWTDRLIRGLELEHLGEVHSRNQMGSKTWRRFCPTWIVRDRGTLDRVLEYFDPVDGSQPECVLTVKQWLDNWELGYRQQFGDIAPSWKSAESRRVYQTLLVEAAVRYALQMGMTNQPEFFLSTPHESRPFYNQMQSGILEAFEGNGDAFQKAFDKAYRQRVGIRVAGAAHLVPTSEQRLRHQMRTIGIDLQKARSWQPQVAATFRTRSAETDVGLVADFIQEFGPSSLPLAAWIREGTEGGNPHEQTTFSWEPINQVLSRHKGINKFIAKLNQELSRRQIEPIVPNLGAKNMAQELVAQAVLYSLLSVQTPTKASFEGFQAQDVNAPLYLEMDADPIQNSQLNLFEINQLVQARLPD